MIGSTKLYSFNLILTMCALFIVSGCGKKNHSPELPYTQEMKKVSVANTAIVKQGFLSENEVKQFIGGTPTTMRAATLHVENKSNKPLTIQIDRYNVGIYDTEDLTEICRKESMRNSNVAIKHNIALLGAGYLTAATAISWIKIMSTLANKPDVWQEMQKMRNIAADQATTGITNGMLGIAATLFLIPLFALEVWMCRSIAASRSRAIINEGEDFFEEYRQMFDSALLTPDDCIEIAPNDSLEQIIFFNAKPRTRRRSKDGIKNDSSDPCQITLCLAQDNQNTLVPLEL